MALVNRTREMISHREIRAWWAACQRALTPAISFQTLRTRHVSARAPVFPAAPQICWQLLGQLGGKKERDDRSRNRRDLLRPSRIIHPADSERGDPRGVPFQASFTGSPTGAGKLGGRWSRRSIPGGGPSSGRGPPDPRIRMIKGSTRPQGPGASGPAGFAATRRPARGPLQTGKETHVTLRSVLALLAMATLAISSSAPASN